MHTAPAGPYITSRPHPRYGVGQGQAPGRGGVSRSSPQVQGRTGPRAGGEAARGVRAVVAAQVMSRTRARGGAGREDRNGDPAQTPDQAVRQPAYPSPPLSSRERYLLLVRTVLVSRENGGCPGRWHVAVPDRTSSCSQRPQGKTALPSLPPCHALSPGTPGQARTLPTPCPHPRGGPAPLPSPLPASWRHTRAGPHPARVLAAPPGHPRTPGAPRAGPHPARALAARPGHPRTPKMTTPPVPYQAPRAGPRRTGARARGAWWTRSGRSSAQCAPGSARRRTPGGRAGSRRHARHAGTRHARRRGR